MARHGCFLSRPLRALPAPPARDCGDLRKGADSSIVAHSACYADNCARCARRFRPAAPGRRDQCGPRHASSPSQGPVDPQPRDDSTGTNYRTPFRFSCRRTPPGK
ncbi:putative protein without homology [Propionibacterium freudenreichii subsp. shermanii]|nr:putative protein without homology [Propionibacterium freudenreichii subsp. shermanii]